MKGLHLHAKTLKEYAAYFLYLALIETLQLWQTVLSPIGVNMVAQKLWIASKIRWTWTNIRATQVNMSGSVIWLYMLKGSKQPG